MENTAIVLDDFFLQSVFSKRLWYNMTGNLGSFWCEILLIFFNSIFSDQFMCQKMLWRYLRVCFWSCLFQWFSSKKILRGKKIGAVIFYWNVHYQAHSADTFSAADCFRIFIKFEGMENLFLKNRLVFTQ